MTRTSPVLYASAYYEIALLDDPRIVKITRSARPFESAMAVESACAPVQAALDALGRRSHRAIIDSRQAIGRNDATYEQWFADHRRRMLLGFERVAILVKTPVGMLQARRLLSIGRLTLPRVFLDEQLALHYVGDD